MKKKIVICTDLHYDVTAEYLQQYLIVCSKCNCLCFKYFGGVCHICNGLLIRMGSSCILCTLRYKKQVDK